MVNKENQFLSIFESLAEHAPIIAKSNFRTRSKKLKKVERALMSYRMALKEALYQDFKKTDAEVDLTEIYPILQESKFIRRRLREWMHPHAVPTPPRRTRRRTTRSSTFTGSTSTEGSTLGSLGTGAGARRSCSTRGSPNAPCWTSRRARTSDPGALTPSLRPAPRLVSRRSAGVAER